ncbi:hypothetical protein [Alishewanella phage vB_AspM_Slickus01]|nr:hypothetical protein [Alishewanella phage vB_AspM_Slickus01]
MLYPYRKSEQIERYIGQFIRVFSGFQIPTSSTNATLKRIPIVYSTMDRVTASLLNNRETFTNKKLPIMSVNMTNISNDPRRKLPNTHVDEISVGDLFYDRLTGIPFILEMEVNIYADSTTQLLEIFENIVLLFHPRVAIQIDSHLTSNEYITEITLDSINPEIQYPLGQSERVVMMALSFNLPIVMRFPVGEKSEMIKTIKQRIMLDSAQTIPTIETLISESESTP